MASPVLGFGIVVVNNPLNPVIMTHDNVPVPLSIDPVHEDCYVDPAGRIVRLNGDRAHLINGMPPVKWWRRKASPQLTPSYES